MSENWQRSEICIVINGKWQDLRCDELLYCTFITQSSGERIFKMSKHFAKLQAKSLIVSYASLALNACPQRCRTCGISKITRRGSKILQGQVSNPSERGTPQLFWPMLPDPNNLFGVRRNSWRQAVIRHLELRQIPYLSSYSSCFVFTKHPVQQKTVTTCFQNMFFSKKVT